MNKKILSIISGIIILLAGSGVAIANITEDDELTDISTGENFSEISTENTPEEITEETSEIITESEAETEIFMEAITEPITEIFSEEATDYFTDDNNYVEYHFRNKKLLNQHFEKHGGEFDYPTAYDYEKGASAVINNSDALFKTEAEDGDGVYYIEQSNEFVILSTDGYIRTYFRPSAGIDYFNRQ